MGDAVTLTPVEEEQGRICQAMSRGPRVILFGRLDASEIEPRTWWTIQAEANLMWEIYQEGLFLTALRNGVHGPCSWHYLGRAWDSLWPFYIASSVGEALRADLKTRWRDTVAARLPSRIQVIRHDTHLHHELERG